MPHLETLVLLLLEGKIIPSSDGKKVWQTVL